jgi:hypothetical protein
VNVVSRETGGAAHASDDELARELLGAAQSFTGNLTAVATRLHDRRPELAGHLNQLAADIAGAVLEAIRTWPVPGR